MRFSISSVCVLVLSLVSVNAFVIRDAPAEATTVKHQHAIDRIPEPTAGPGVQELRRRQAATQKTLLGAPDNTCGYLNGDSCLYSFRTSQQARDYVCSLLTISHSSAMGLCSRF